MLSSHLRSAARRRAGLPPAPAPHRRGAAVLEFCLSLVPWTMMLAIMLDIMLASSVLSNMDTAAYRLARHTAVQGGPGKFADLDDLESYTTGLIGSSAVRGSAAGIAFNSDDIFLCMHGGSDACSSASYTALSGITSSKKPDYDCDSMEYIVAVRLDYHIFGFLVMGGGLGSNFMNLSADEISAYAADRCHV